MKPYKILKPQQSLWQINTVDVFMTEKKILKLPLKLFMKCSPIYFDKLNPNTLKLKKI